MQENRAVFLDRDGTINVDKGYLYKPEDIKYLPGVLDALKFLQDMGYLLIVVTNQSGIARGYYTEEQYLELQDWINSDLRSKGIFLTKTYYCPHLEGAKICKYDIKCDCRKPKTGLYWKAVAEFNISLKDSFVIGDKESDLSLVEDSDVKGILLGSAKSDKYKSCNNWQEVINYIRDSKNE